jgi:hypothetical protein
MLFYPFSDLINARFACRSLALWEILLLGNTRVLLSPLVSLRQLPTFLSNRPIFLSPNHQDAHT